MFNFNKTDKTVLNLIAYNPYDENSFDKEEKAKGKIFTEAKKDQRAADQIIVERVEQQKQEIIDALIEHINRLEKQITDLGETPVK